MLPISDLYQLKITEQAPKAFSQTSPASWCMAGHNLIGNTKTVEKGTFPYNPSDIDKIDTSKEASKGAL